MAQYNTKRKYTKKPTGAKKVVKKVVKETTEVIDVPAVQIPPVPTVTVKSAKKSLWQKVVDWVKEQFV